MQRTRLDQFGFLLADSELQSTATDVRTGGDMQTANIPD